MTALTEVELIHLEGKIERWIRFGREVQERILDRRRRVLALAPGAVRHAGPLDRRSHADRKPRRSSGAVAERGRRPHADHAGDLRKPRRALRPRRRSLKRPQQHHCGRGLPPGTLRPLRGERFSRRLQCRSRSLGRSSERRSSAARRDRSIPVAARAVDRCGHRSRIEREQPSRGTLPSHRTDLRRAERRRACGSACGRTGPHPPSDR